MAVVDDDAACNSVVLPPRTLVLVAVDMMRRCGVLQVVFFECCGNKLLPNNVETLCLDDMSQVFQGEEEDENREDVLQVRRPRFVVAATLHTGRKQSQQQRFLVVAAAIKKACKVARLNFMIKH